MITIILVSLGCIWLLGCVITIVEVAHAPLVDKESDL
jgi:hypothetical protein